MQGKDLLYAFVPLSSGISICMMSSILVAVVPYVKIANASVCGFDSIGSVMSFIIWMICYLLTH